MKPAANARDGAAGTSGCGDLFGIIASLNRRNAHPVSHRDRQTVPPLKADAGKFAAEWRAETSVGFVLDAWLRHTQSVRWRIGESNGRQKNCCSLSHA